MQTGLQQSPPPEALEEQRDERSLLPTAHRVDARSLGWSLQDTGATMVGTAFLYPPLVMFLDSGLPDWLKTGTCALGLVTGAVAAWGKPWLSRRFVEHAFRKIPARSHLHGAARGELVRLRGRVQLRQESLRSLGGHKAVVARSLGMFGRNRGWAWGGVRCETHAVDFDLRLEHVDGATTSVRICGPHLQLLPHPPPMPTRLDRARAVLAGHPGPDVRRSSWVYDQQCVSPGDEIEVAGAVDFAADASGPSGSSDRQARLAPMLVGSETQPLRLRRVLPPG